MVDILKREKEFQKLNDELDKKAKSIIEKSSDISSRIIKLKNQTVLDGNKNKSKSLFKANTIPKRFRDSLTNRKIKGFLINPENNEKSAQISENEVHKEYKIEIEESRESENQQKLKENLENMNKKEEVEKQFVQEIEIENSSVYKTSNNNEIKQKINLKANTVPKGLRESLTNRKGKVNKKTEVNEKLIEKSEIQEHSIIKDNVITEKEINCINNEAGAELNEVAPSTVNTLSMTKSNCSSLKSIKSFSSDSSFKKNSSNYKKFGDTSPQTKKLTSEGLVKYLKSKVSILEVEISNQKNGMLQQNKELEICYDTQKKLEAQRDQAISKNNSLTEQIEHLNEKIKTYEKKTKDMDTELISEKREIENIRRELKINNQTNKNLEKRLYRTNEELENTKLNCDSLKKKERNHIEAARLEKDKLEKQIKELKRQRNEFLNAYKKQLFLIDNLKRQNICMEQCQIIGFGEKQFAKILDFNKE